jgi:hypothetical protein
VFYKLKRFVLCLLVCVALCDISDGITITYDFPVKSGHKFKISRLAREIIQEYSSFFQLKYTNISPVEIRFVTDFSFHNKYRAPKWANAFFLNGVVLIPQSTLDKGDIRRALRHELSHLVVYRGFGPNVPEWLDEGLALYLEGDQTQLLVYYDLWKQNRKSISLRKLASGMTSLSYSDVAKAYAISYVSVASLIKKGYKQKVLEVLHTYKHSTNPKELASFMKLSEDQLKH